MQIVRSPLWVVPADVVRVVDGDTFDVMADLGFRVYAKLRIRLHGVNAPEKDTDAGSRAAHWLQDTIGPADVGQLGERVTVRGRGPDKYGGRWQADVTLLDGTDLAALMVHEGHAKAWDGTGTRPT